MLLRCKRGRRRLAASRRCLLLPPPPPSPSRPPISGTWASCGGQTAHSPTSPMRVRASFAAACTRMRHMGAGSRRGGLPGIPHTAARSRWCAHPILHTGYKFGDQEPPAPAQEPVTKGLAEFLQPGVTQTQAILNLVAWGNAQPAAAGGLAAAVQQRAFVQAWVPSGNPVAGCACCSTHMDGCRSWIPAAPVPLPLLRRLGGAGPAPWSVHPGAPGRHHPPLHHPARRGARPDHALPAKQHDRPVRCAGRVRG